MKKIAMVVLACTVTNAIQSLAPGAIFNVRGETYQGIEWDASNTQAEPDEPTVSAWIANCQQSPPPTPQELLFQRVTDLESAMQTVSAQTSIPVSLPLAVTVTATSPTPAPSQKVPTQ